MCIYVHTRNKVQIHRIRLACASAPACVHAAQSAARLTHACTCTHIYRHKRLYTHMYDPISLCMRRALLDLHIHIYIYIYTYINTNKSVNMYRIRSACVRATACVHAAQSTARLLFTYIYIYINQTHANINICAGSNQPIRAPLPVCTPSRMLLDFRIHTCIHT